MGIQLSSRWNESTTLLLIKQDGGIRPYLLERGVPIVLANVWIGSLSDSKDNSQEAFARDIRFFYQYFSSAGVDVEARLADLKSLTKREVAGAVRRLCVRDGKNLKKATCRRRLEAVRSFLRFAQDHQISTQALTRDQLHGVSVYFTAIERKVSSAFKRHINLGANPVHATVLTEDEVEKVHLVMHPDSKLNPFRDRATRVRNYCILRLACVIAPRRSELVLLELSDLDLGGSPTVAVKRPTVRVTAQRRDRSALKTQTKTIPLDSDVAMTMADYVENHRPVLVGKGRVSTALFPSTKDGRRLSGSSINRIFSQVAKAIDPTQAFRLHPHGLRATSTTAQRRHLQGLSSLTDADILLALSYHGGWAPGSESVRLYTRVAVQERVERILGLRASIPKVMK